MQLPGELPAKSFKGKGNGTAEKNPDGTYDVTMELDTRTKYGGKFTFVVEIDDFDIDDNIAMSMSGQASFKSVTLPHRDGMR
jgi:hypothetical protein